MCRVAPHPELLKGIARRQNAQSKDSDQLPCAVSPFPMMRMRRTAELDIGPVGSGNALRKRLSTRTAACWCIILSTSFDVFSVSRTEVRVMMVFVRCASSGRESERRRRGEICGGSWAKNLYWDRRIERTVERSDRHKDGGMRGRRDEKATRYTSRSLPRL